MIEIKNVPQHAVIDGRVIAFFRDLPPGTQYYMERQHQDDPGATPYTRGIGPEDRNRERHNHDCPVLIHKWPQQEDQS